MDLNLIYRALAAGEIDVTAGDATSGLIEALQLAVLEDDRHYFPVYDAVAGRPHGGAPGRTRRWRAALRGARGPPHGRPTCGR